MAGHSHWAGIKHKKGREDARRGKLFSKLAKHIMSAARRGGGNPDMNLELQYAIEAAKQGNVPKENIERAILKATGQLEGETLEPARYEGYGSGGAAVMMDALTDNRNRTNAEIRNIFSSHGAKVGNSGCVSWLFETKGLIILKLDDGDEEEVFDMAVEAGAEDFQKSGDYYEITCSVADLGRLKEALQKAAIGYESAEITQAPQNYVDLNVQEGRRILALMEEIEDHDDVESVYSNFNLPEELVTELGEQ